LGAIADRWLDTSNFEHTHPLYSATNFRALGKFKSETADLPPTEFCGLRSNIYSLSTLTGDREYRKAKGVQKSYVKKTRHPRTIPTSTSSLVADDVQVSGGTRKKY